MGPLYISLQPRRAGSRGSRMAASTPADPPISPRPYLGYKISNAAAAAGEGSVRCHP
jgi:hypothetical protein